MKEKTTKEISELEESIELMIPVIRNTVHEINTLTKVFENDIDLLTKDLGDDCKFKGNKFEFYEIIGYPELFRFNGIFCFNEPISTLPSGIKEAVEAQEKTYFENITELLCTKYTPLIDALRSKHAELKGQTKAKKISSDEHKCESPVVYVVDHNKPTLQRIPFECSFVNYDGAISTDIPKEEAFTEKTQKKIQEYEKENDVDVFLVYNPCKTINQEEMLGSIDIMEDYERRDEDRISALLEKILKRVRKTEARKEDNLTPDMVAEDTALNVMFPVIRKKYSDIGIDISESIVHPEVYINCCHNCVGSTKYNCREEEAANKVYERLGKMCATQLRNMTNK